MSIYTRLVHLKIFLFWKNLQENVNISKGPPCLRASFVHSSNEWQKSLLSLSSLNSITTPRENDFWLITMRKKKGCKKWISKTLIKGNKWTKEIYLTHLLFGTWTIRYTDEVKRPQLEQLSKAQIKIQYNQCIYQQLVPLTHTNNSIILTKHNARTINTKSLINLCLNSQVKKEQCCYIIT